MLNLVAKVEALLLQESLNTLCGVSVVYLTIEDNTLPPYDKVREIVDQAVNSLLAKLTDLGRKSKVLEILPQMWFLVLVCHSCRSGSASPEERCPLDVEGFCSSLTVHDYSAKTMLSKTHLRTHMESGYISVRGLKALKVLNMEKKAPLDRTQEEIEQNLSILKYKLERRM
ncbi:unnamed protein product [Rhizophagus irregularis]|nr:unnamed protein product [Rhizophagus irregularis]